MKRINLVPFYVQCGCYFYSFKITSLVYDLSHLYSYKKRLELVFEVCLIRETEMDCVCIYFIISTFQRILGRENFSLLPCEVTIFKLSLLLLKI